MGLARGLRFAVVPVIGLVTGLLFMLTSAYVAWAVISAETVLNVGLNGPYGVTASADGNYIYVASNSQNQIARISTGDNSYILSPVIGDYTEQMALSSDGSRLYVPLSRVDSIAVINTSTMAVTNTLSVPAGTGPAGVAISAQGDFLVVGGSNADTFVLVNITTGITNSFAACSTPIDVDLSQGDDTVFVTCLSGNVVGAYRVDTGNPVATIPVGNAPYSAVLNNDGSQLYVANSNSNSISVVNISTLSVANTISTLQGPRFVAISPDDSTLAVAGYYPGILQLFDTATRTLSQSLSPSQAPYLEQVAFAGDGASLWLADQSASRISRWDINPPLYTPAPTPTPTPTPTDSALPTLSATGLDTTTYILISAALVGGGVVALAVAIILRRRASEKSE